VIEIIATDVPDRLIALDIVLSRNWMKLGFFGLADTLIL